MQVVVTGCCGFIGRRLCQRLLVAGHDVLGVTRASSILDPLAGLRYQLATLSEPATLLPADWRGDRFLLVHLAWDITQRNNLTVQARHVLELAGLLEHWTPQGLSGVISTGSADEYGIRNGVLQERDPPREPASAYGWSKATVRQLLKNWASLTQRGAIWLRPFTVYGPGQRGNMLIPYAVRQAMLGERAEFTAGYQRRDFVFVDDVVAAMELAVARAAQRSSASARSGKSSIDSPFEIFNLGSGTPVAVRSVLEEIAQLTSAQANFHYGVVPQQPHEPELQVADTQWTERSLGWRATTSLSTGLRQVVEAARKDQRWAA